MSALDREAVKLGIENVLKDLRPPYVKNAYVNRLADLFVALSGDTPSVPPLGSLVRANCEGCGRWVNIVYGDEALCEDCSMSAALSGDTEPSK